MKPAPTTLLQDWQAGPYSIDWGSLPDWLVLFAAIIGTFLALRQLMTTSSAEQGTQLMAIDQQFEGDLVDSRKALIRLRLESEALVAAGRAGSVDIAVRDRLRVLAATRRAIADPDPDRSKAATEAFDEYFAIMRLPLFIETIGVLVDDGLVNDAAVLKLYDAMIVSAIGLVLPHIIEQRRDRDNPELLLHAEQLYWRAQRRLEAARQSVDRRRAAAGP